MSDRAGIYVHVPFCARVCPYCDFAVEVDARESHASYVSALLREVAATPEEPGPVDTVYLGGGTPSVLSADHLTSILFALAGRWRLANDTWITLEANPEDVTVEGAREWRRLGVGTVSLGVQSFDDDELRFLGRKHRAAEARRAVEALRAAGIPLISVDLIFGLPGQSSSTWERNLRAAAKLSPEHVSCYQLTVHEGTPFGDRRAGGKLRELDEESQAEHFVRAHEILGARGFTGYEVSNFAAAPEFRSRHNAKYWRHVPYLGLGPSAHSLLGRTRWWNVRDRAAWETALAVDELPRAETERLDDTALALEMAMLGLRTVEGIDLDRIARATGLDLEPANEAVLAVWVERGLVRRLGTRVVPTIDGMAVSEGLARDLVLPASRAGGAERNGP